MVALEKGFIVMGYTGGLVVLGYIGGACSDGLYWGGLVVMGYKKKQQSQLRLTFLLFAFKDVSLKPFSLMWPNPHSSFFFQEENSKHITFSQDQWCQTHFWNVCILGAVLGAFLLFQVSRKKCCWFSWRDVEHNGEGVRIDVRVCAYYPVTIGDCCQLMGKSSTVSR